VQILRGNPLDRYLLLAMTAPRIDCRRRPGLELIGRQPQSARLIRDQFRHEVAKSAAGGGITLIVPLLEPRKEIIEAS
jgi:hypothetical protein